MHRHKKWQQTGVSEVIGTILILAMTVVLFATIIIWVASIPTPQASIRLDMDGSLVPVYDDTGVWIGANVTIDHRGGETLFGWRTQIFFTIDENGVLTTEVLKTRGNVGGIPYGIDGPDED
jgi:flagellin-like protein